MKHLRVLSLFSGIGAFEKALTNIGVDYELVNYCEVDKYASKSYSLIHNIDESFNLGDITKIEIDKLNDFDLLTHGSPCQDFSIAGKQEGGDRELNTRSSLMWNTVEIIKVKKPKYVIWENVKNVLSKKHRHNFDKYVDELNELGYISYHKVLNSKDFCVPQNRERIFVVSILGEHTPYEFPQGFDLNVKLKDVLEDKVDEKFYMNKPFILINKERVNSTCNQVAKLEMKGNDCIRRVYDVDYCSPTLSTCGGGNREAKILEVKPCASRGRYNKNGKIEQQLEVRKDDVSNCLTSVQTDALIQENIIIDDTQGFDGVRYYEEYSPTLRAGRSGLKTITESRVRKLTPREYWRLQAFSDEDFNKCVNAKISNSQLYKQAGNSITVKVLEYIFKELFKN